MIRIIRRVIKSVLMSLYQPFLFAIVASVLVMFVVMYLDKYKGTNIKYRIKSAAIDWKNRFASSVKFRRFFYFMFCLIMILFITLMNRDMWANPVIDVVGVWGLHKQNGTFTTEIIENVVLFVPFVFCLFYFLETTSKKCIGFISIMVRAISLSFLFSLTIEMLQLFFRLGTWQLSDICFNTLGGIIGALLYWISTKIRRIKKEENVEGNNIEEKE